MAGWKDRLFSKRTVERCKTPQTCWNTGNIWLVLLPCCCDLRRKMYVSMPCFFRCERGAQSRNGLLLSPLPKHRPALTGELCRFIPNTGDGVWDCSPGSSFMYSRGSFSARTSLTAFHNSTMIIAASEYWHKVLLWFFSASFFDLRKEKSTLPYWLPVLCSKAVVHSSIVTACNTQTTCKETALQHLLLLTGQFPSLLCHLHPSKTKSANKCHSMRLASMDLSPQGA